MAEGRPQKGGLSPRGVGRDDRRQQVEARLVDENGGSSLDQTPFLRAERQSSRQALRISSLRWGAL